MRAHWFMLSIVAIAACGVASGANPPDGGGGPPPMPVEMATIRPTPLRDSTEYVALMRSRRSVQVQPQVVGHVTSIAVTSGDRVAPGTMLMQIDPDQQQAALKSQLGARDANRAAVEYAQKRLARVRHLTQGGAATKQDLDQAQTALEQAKGSAAASEAQARAGSVQLGYFRIVAPSAGTVGDIPVRLGDYVTPQTLLTTLDDNDVLEAYVDVPVERAPLLTLGTDVEIVDGTGALLAPSRVTFISPRADPATQMVLVKSTVDNASGKLRAAQFARARVIWSRHEGLVVPVLSVQARAGQSFVWVVSEQPGGKLTVQPRPVVVGRIEGQSYPVTKGLKAGERIVVSGVQKLRPGAPVTPTPSRGGPKPGV